ncbi:MAG: adenylate/guanylate cyclase domain-containing protein [Spirochaetaceae bacterium]|nr:MAG: adenylate/guanylate cyclase domain-containing protein [Spirochaetaceae bacterium]
MSALQPDHTPRTARVFTAALLRGSIVAAIAAACALLLWFSGALETFEARTWDARARFFASRREPDQRVVLILLDQASLDWARDAMGLTWPWPREVYSYLVNFVGRANTEALAFDVLYLEPSAFGVFDDQAFGTAIAQYERFVGSAFFGQETGTVLQWPLDVPLPRVEAVRTAAAGRGERDPVLEYRYPRAAFPIPEVSQNSRVLSNVQLEPDSDGVYRRARPIVMFDGQVVPSLGLATWLASLEAGSALTLELDGNTLRAGEHSIPLDASGRVILQFKNERGRHRDFSAAAILQSEIQLLSGEEPLVDPTELDGAYVLFGFSAPGLFDLRTSPITSLVPGVDVHATLLENLLSDDFIRPFPVWGAVALTVLLVLASALIATLIAGAGPTVVAYLVLLPVPTVAAFIGYHGGYWVPLLLPTVGVGLALVGSSVANYATEGKQKRYIKNAFQQYLSPDVIEELIQDPGRLRLGGERRELSIFFSDLQGFTSLSEGLSPEDLTALLNEYLSAMTDIIHDEGGTVDKYEGDAIIAFWNAPLAQEDHAERAVRAALRCQQKLAELRPVFAERVGKELFMRIGINSGPAVVGNMGSRTRFDYTMLGDSVNLAARLEGINKQFGTYTMISHATLSRTGSLFAARELSRVAVVGRAEPVVVYEPFFPDEFERERPRLDAFRDGLQSYYAGNFADAEARFTRISTQDPPAAHYLARCRELQEQPPLEWDGVWVMTSK